MKRYLLFISAIFLFLLAGISLHAQEKTAYKTEKDILYRKGDNLTDYMKERCRLDVYYPENKTDFTTIVWFHDGGLTGGGKFIPAHWKEKGFAVIAVNYRLAPEVKCPAYIEDAAAAVDWVFRHIGKYGGSQEKIVLSGHSAGAYLVSMIGLDKHYLADLGIDANRIAALIPLSGFAITHKEIREEQDISELKPIVDKFAPLYHVRADAPPFYLITGDRELEMLGRYEENAYLYRMMKLNGHKKTYLYELDGFNHGEMAVPATELTLLILKQLGLN
ncbi:MAG: alpha/beta hydrolase [Tannerella sp.]|jgi:acetyl esterase/lipase|nr:alpha/beta hydrolase [Tannerella sp.]